MKYSDLKKLVDAIEAEADDVVVARLGGDAGENGAEFDIKTLRTVRDLVVLDLGASRLV